MFSDVLAKRLYRQSPKHLLTKSYISTMKKELPPYLMKAHPLPGLKKGSDSTGTILLARVTICPKTS